MRHALRTRPLASFSEASPSLLPLLAASRAPLVEPLNVAARRAPQQLPACRIARDVGADKVVRIGDSIPPFPTEKAELPARFRNEPVTSSNERDDLLDPLGDGV